MAKPHATPLAGTPCVRAKVQRHPLAARTTAALALLMSAKQAVALPLAEQTLFGSSLAARESKATGLHFLRKACQSLLDSFSIPTCRAAMRRV